MATDIRQFEIKKGTYGLQCPSCGISQKFRNPKSKRTEHRLVEGVWMIMADNARQVGGRWFHDIVCRKCNKTTAVEYRRTA